MRLKKNMVVFAITLLVLMIANLSTYSTSEALTYKVQSGDSLYTIAKKFGSSVNDIKAANNLTATQLKIGQALVIPQIGRVVTITAKSINFRTGPATTNTVIKNLPQGTQGVYLATKNGWYQMRLLTGQTGWVINWSAKVTVGTPKAPAAPSRGTTYKTGQTTTSLNLRATPATTGKVLAVLAKGTKVLIRAVQGSWYQIETPSKVIGWAAAKYITTGSITPPATPAPPANPKPTTPPAANPGTGGTTTTTNPPTTTIPPVTTPPTTTPPTNTPPADNNSGSTTTPPAATPPADNNGGTATTPPVTTPPADNNGGSTTTPPATTPPADDNGGSTTTPPATTPKGKNVMGYHARYWDGDNLSQQSLEANSDLITTIGTFSYGLDEQGALNGTHDARAMTTAREKGVAVLAMIHNFVGDTTKNKAVAKAVLANSATRTKVVNSVFDLMEKYHYDGINVDIEFVAPADRNNYTAFIKELAAKLKPKGYAVTVSVPAKLRDDPNHGWSGGFDFVALNNYADLFMIMAYDEHTYGTDPGPVASLSWVEEVIKYTISVIPAEKVLLGIPTYGSDWNLATKSLYKSYSYSQAMQAATANGKSILWDDVAKVPYFKYTKDGQEHGVWFENARSTEEKLKLVNKYNLAGIAMWRLGFEDPATWQAIDRQMDPAKN